VVDAFFVTEAEGGADAVSDPKSLRPGGAAMTIAGVLWVAFLGACTASYGSWPIAILDATPGIALIVFGLKHWITGKPWGRRG
jgi:hypothetical protein